MSFPIERPRKKSIYRNLKSLTRAKHASFTPPLGAWGERKKADYPFCIHCIRWNYPLFPATGNSCWNFPLFPATGNSYRKVICDVPNRFSVTLQSPSPFSASLQTFCTCLTADTYLNRQKYGLFCSLLGLTAMRYLYLNLWTVCSWFIAFINHAPSSSASCMWKMFWLSYCWSDFSKSVNW